MAAAPGGHNVPVVGSVISLFSGAGGLDLGVEPPGSGPSPPSSGTTTPPTRWRRTRRRTSPTSARCCAADLYPLATGTAGGVTTRDILRAGGLGRRERPDLLIGGPPCVAFSKSGFWLDWKRDGADPAASLLQAYTRVLAEARPRHFILENVYALTFSNRASRPAYRAAALGDQREPGTTADRRAERSRPRRPAGPAAAVHRRRPQGREGCRNSPSRPTTDSGSDAGRRVARSLTSRPARPSLG